MGGPHATSRPLEVINNEEVDYVVVGEGEKTIVELMAGADLMCGVGLLEDSSCLFYEEIVIDNEIVGAIARLIRGERADDETMALDLIEKVGVGKNFLAQRHTVDHFKSEHFKPTLIDRRSYDAWSQTGSKTLRDAARDRVKKILAEHKVAPIAADRQKGLTAVIEKAKKPMWGGESKVQ